MGNENWRQRLTVKNIVLFGLVLVIVVSLSFLLGRPKPFNYLDGWDFLTFWEGPYLLAQGQNPYDSASWLAIHAEYGFPPQNQVYVYPLPLAVVMLPLGLLPLFPAAVVWVALSILSILVACFLIFTLLRINFSVAYLLPVMCGVFFFRPSAVTLWINQIDGFILLWLTAGMFLWARKKPFFGNMVIALTVLKPQLGVPIVALLVLWQLQRRQWEGIAGAGLSLGILFGLGVLFDPVWLPNWLSIGGSKVSQNFYSTPTLWGLSSIICKPSLECTRWLGAALALLCTAFIIWVFLRKNNTDVMFTIAAIGVGVLLISPYLWVYSQVLLVLPVLMITGSLFRRNMPYLLTATFPLLTALFSFLMVLVSSQIGADIPSVLVPLTLLLLLGWVYQGEPADQLTQSI